MAYQEIPERLQLNFECKYFEIFLKYSDYSDFLIIAGNLFHSYNWAADWVPAHSLHLPADSSDVPHLPLQQCSVSSLAWLCQRSQ